MNRVKLQDFATEIRASFKRKSYMTELIPTQPFVFTFPEDNEGKEVKYRFMLTLGKKLSAKIGEETVGGRLEAAIMTLAGIDAMQPAGRYTIECVIARTFDADVVIDELKRRLNEDVLTEIVKPRLVT